VASYVILLGLEITLFLPVVQMKKILLIIITLHLSVSHAVADVDLYSGEVFVASQSVADRDKALPAALAQVLEKLSGLRELPLSPALDEALNDANRLLRSYRYARADRTAADGTITQELQLVALFMQAEVDRIVQQAGLPRWRKERPAVQVWVVLDNGLNRQLKPLEFDYAWESVERISEQRGLPIIWSELDEEEKQLLDMRLVWGGFTDYLVERGAPQDGVAIIAAARVGPQWNVRWNLASGSQSWSWQISDFDLMNALAEGAHQMADHIAAGNTIAASEQGVYTIDMTVGGLNNARSYAHCLGYLQNLSLVNAVEILGADPGRVHFRLQLNASQEHLSEALRLGTVLLPARAGRGYDYEFSP